MRPLAASEPRIEVRADGTRLLRFTTTSWNAGRGPLEIVGGATDAATGKQQVFQRVYDDAGGYEDVPAGQMDWHSTHGHVHFNDYATYTLRPAGANGASERYGEKVSFCLIDTDRVDRTLAASPKRPVYTTCGAQRQGISVGWGDGYRYYLDGQHIDITGLPNGDYVLLINVDPKNRIEETDDQDNVSSTTVRITGNSVELVSGGGRGRPNR